ncbi:N-formylmaleamate deformylase [Variovorax sp. PBS-H4]|uniref:alpha/beta fold hydrolase n=1 Tax=Variovorax sp. PBS-H4 TaxID=434008 RepID=UPI001317D812|nr:alpha/beta hydrolase [Variovorax sp. PBS-H4]VTU23175.1 N-formylmaleamate deformylase [Variovorax sp. PBS-H4]
MTLASGAHIRANGIRQHYLHFAGTGPRVLIVPGIVSPAILWRHVGEWLCATHDCFVLDVRGRGLSESGAHLDYGFDTCAADLVAFVRTLSLGPLAVVGHSMGARIAVRAAAGAPELFESLILIDPPTSGPGRRPYPIPKSRTLELLRSAQRADGVPAAQAGGAGPWPGELQRLRFEWLPTCDERAVHAAYDDFHAQDLFEDLARTTVPVSLVAAGTGGVMSDADIEEMRRVRTGLRAVRLAGVGHQMQAEDFATFSRALGAMLGNQDSETERHAS